MKKISVYLFLLVMACFISACGKKTTTTVSSTTVTTTTVSTTTTSTTQKSEHAVLNGVEDVYISVGEEYTKMTGVTAVDSDGTDLTDQIKVTGLFNYNKTGSYKLTYKVTGKSGVEVTAQRTIYVLEDAYIVTNGVSVVVVSGQSFNPLEGVLAFDGDEDITDQIEVVLPEGYSLDVAGVYTIVYKVTGSNKKTVEVEFTVTVVVASPVSIFFGSKDEPTTGDIEISTDSPFDALAGLNVIDYDGEDLKDYVTVEGIVNNYVAGTYTLTYKATGKNNEETTLVRTITVVDRYIEVDGNRFAVEPNNIDNPGIFEGTAGTAKAAVSILTHLPEEELGTSGYPVVVICDANGRIIYARDPFLGEYTLENPIRTFKKDAPYNSKDASAGGATTFTNSKMLKGLTSDDIPEGGFLLVFNFTEGNSTEYSELHPARKFGLDMCRRIGALVTVHGLEIEGYTQKSANELVIFDGVEDLYLTTNSTFDELNGVTAKKGTTAAQVSVVKSTVDMSAAGHYYVLYKATLGNEEVYYTRRVVVATTLQNAYFSGGDVVVSLNAPTDLSKLIYAFEFSHESLNYKMTIEDGGFDFTKEGVYTVTYKVTGQSGVEVTKTIKVTVTNKPIITIPSSSMTIEYGAPFDIENGLVVQDYDGSLLNYTISEYDLTKVGTQTITITAQGKYGKTSIVVTLTILGPKPTLNIPTNYTHIINNPINLLDGVSASDYNGTVLNVTYSIYLIEAGNLTPVQTLDTTTLGKYRVVYTVTGEYQTIEKSVDVEITNPDPYFAGLGTKVVFIGDAFDPYQGVEAFTPYGEPINKDNITVNYIDGEVNTASAGSYRIEYSINYESYTTTKEITINVVEKPTKDTVYVNGVKMEDSVSVMLNAPISNATAGAGNLLYVFDGNTTVPKAIGSNGAQVCSTMVVVDKYGQIRLARVWYKVDGGEYIEELSFERGKLELAGPSEENKYLAATKELGAIKGNIILSGNGASEWELGEGEKLFLFGGHGGQETTCAWWARALISVGATVQFYDAE